MSDLVKRYQQLLAELPEGVQLIAVSKTKPASDIQTLFEAGQIDFGENRVQELVEKEAELPKGIRWHMIGHLQRNKVKMIAPFVHLIHGVDSPRLLAAVNKEGIKIDRKIPILMQVHIAEESSKFGFDFEELEEFLAEHDFAALAGIEIRGLMGMATFSSDMELVRSEFARLSALAKKLQEQYAEDLPYFDQISMGMSGDWKIAVEEGSTMIRVGSSIFGSRN
jgi:pyridoxal phosphate enzyme (YggS family)